MARGVGGTGRHRGFQGCELLCVRLEWLTRILTCLSKPSEGVTLGNWKPVFGVVMCRCRLFSFSKRPI